MRVEILKDRYVQTAEKGEALTFLFENLKDSDQNIDQELLKDDSIFKVDGDTPLDEIVKMTLEFSQSDEFNFCMTDTKPRFLRSGFYNVNFTRSELKELLKTFDKSKTSRRFLKEMTFEQFYMRHVNSKKD